MGDDSRCCDGCYDSYETSSCDYGKCSEIILLAIGYLINKSEFELSLENSCNDYEYGA